MEIAHFSVLCWHNFFTAFVDEPPTIVDMKGCQPFTKGSDFFVSRCDSLLAASVDKAPAIGCVAYPEAIGIESLNSVIRHATKKRKIFPTDDSVRKVVYLAIEAASKKWNMPIRDWRTAMSRFLIEFEDRLENFM